MARFHETRYLSEGHDEEHGDCEVERDRSTWYEQADADGYQIQHYCDESFASGLVQLVALAVAGIQVRVGGVSIQGDTDKANA